MRYVYVITFALAVLGLYLCQDLATAYVEVGHGLHPALAVVLGCTLTLAGWQCLVRAARA